MLIERRSNTMNSGDPIDRPACPSQAWYPDTAPIAMATANANVATATSRMIGSARTTASATESGALAGVGAASRFIGPGAGFARLDDMADPIAAQPAPR
ncbi:MAG: hypothetical protein U1F23_04085 [Lysobacterales bacterium]